MTVTYEATRAAFVFKKGHNRKDYEKALPYFVRYYRSIRNAGDMSFNVDRAAKLELEWWIVHRERKKAFTIGFGQWPGRNSIGTISDETSGVYCNTLSIKPRL